MVYTSIPKHSYDPKCKFLQTGSCYWCCQRCNTVEHICPGCGTELDHNGLESNGVKHPDCTK